jgi:hypothetical protein
LNPARAWLLRARGIRQAKGEISYLARWITGVWPREGLQCSMWR